MELTHDEIKAILERQREICGKGYLLYCKDHNLNASTICQRMIKGASEPYVSEEYYNYNNSNRLDGVVIQKPAGIEQLKASIEKSIKAMEYTMHQEVGVIITTNAIQECWKVIDKELPAMLLAENGEGYAEGIKTINEVHTNSQKLLLDECCEALGWQGGTIHQIKNVLSAARRVKLVHDEVELSNDWDKFKAAIVTLKAVV